jgi:hypothetical protein
MGIRFLRGPYLKWLGARRFPIPYMVQYGEKEFPIWQYLYFAPGMRRTRSLGLFLDDRARLEIGAGSMKLWESQYIPSVHGLEGKTVMDVGAGCGETAWLFFKHGAKKVIAIESNPLRVYCLHKNAEKFGWDIEIRGRKFELGDLDTPRDFAKVDIEGYEQLLLERPDKLGQMTVEVHTWYMREEFKKLGFMVVFESNGEMKTLGECVMVNWIKDFRK